ncbi:MAG: hypothetical protein ACU843_08495 [Gammaproteobacteria bacterium]
MSVQTCKPVEILSTKYCTVWQCLDCGSVHLQLGNLTLQLSPKQMQGIVLGLLEAMRRMDRLHADRFCVANHPSLPN